MNPTAQPKAPTITMTIAVAAVAAALGWQIAEENYLAPSLLAVTAAAVIVNVTGRMPSGATLLGLLLFGYMVGNRGFAQLMPFPQVPLLPAEIFLAGGVGWLLWQGARSKQLPARTDALNVCILIWILIGSSRIAMDVRAHGALALRDFATVYYALFFFIAQRLSDEPAARVVVVRFLIAGSLLQPPVYALSEMFPGFFLDALALRGAPLIYFKGDLALTFTAASSTLIALVAPVRWRRWSWPAASIGILAVIGNENRASMVAALSALIWLAFSRARRLAALQLSTIIIALICTLALTFLADSRWAGKKLDGVTERLASISDFAGQGAYHSDESYMKGDNNRFRSLWWTEVVAEAVRESPWFGLGFGHDLAREFLRIYSPGSGEDFSARSPHSILVTVFGRMGLIGFVPFVAICTALMIRLISTLRSNETETARLGLWLAACIILTSSLFGVVLEGPMGAVLFWSVAGLANGWPEAPESSAASPLPR